MGQLTPYLAVKDAAAAIEFYTRGLGATEEFRMTGDDGRIGHAEIHIGDDVVYLADEFPEMAVVSPQTLGGTPVTLHLNVADVDATFAQAVAAGATSLREPADQFYGDRNATILDPFGHRWMLSTRIEEMTAEEMERRAAAEGYAT
jgi:PhnB protein